MKIKQFAFFLAVSTLFSLTAYTDDVSYEQSRDGNYFYLNPFSHKPATAAEHWDYAVSLREKGDLSAARKQFETLVKRWPESAQAAPAQQAVGDIYFEQGEDQKAFEAYKELIQTYYTGLTNYNEVLENQYAIAQREMARKRMKILFGGYTAPERAVPYLESIIRNAPQWERAPEMQFQIGEAYRKDGDYEMAVVAYTTVEYRYADSPFAEKAAFAKVQCLKKLVEKTPYSVDLREQGELAVELFAANYPQSEHLAAVEHFADQLTEMAASHDYEIASFYERKPTPDKPESARIYYKKVIEEHTGTDYADASSERLRVLFPADEELLAEITAVEEAAEAAKLAPREPLPERLVEDEEAVEVTADRMEYEGDLLVGEGHVAIQQAGSSLQADYVSVNPETGDITATGNIVMLRDGTRWTGEELLYNFKTKEGNFGESDIYFEPVYITAEKTERLGTNEFLMVNARITTCSGDSPLIYAKAREVRVIDENKPSGQFIKAKDVTFYVGKVPVFYTPFWQRHLGYRVFTFAVGYGGRLGAFIMGRAELHPTDWLISNTHLDLYSKRGLGVGQDFNWTTPNGYGGIKTYYIHDQDPHENDDLTAAEQALIDSSRYRVRLDHREQVTDSTYFQTEFNYLSDPGILEDFFSDEFRREANPENYAVVQHATNDYAASLRIDKRLNDFYTSVDRLPELGFNWYRTPVEHTPFYFQSDNSIGFYQMLYGTNGIPDYSSTRLDTYNQLFLPIRMKEFFNIIPRAAYRGTWYSNTPALEAKYRNIFELGMLTSFKAHKVMTDKSGFYGDGLRHILEPYADYSYRAEPSVATNMLYQFDEIDALDEQNEIRFGLRNFIQTKRGAKRIVNFLDADVYSSYRFDPLGNQDRFGPLVADLQMRLTDNFRIQSDLEYDLHADKFDAYNARLKYITADQSQYAFEYRYLDETRSLFSASTELFPNNDWSYQFLARYDATLDEWRDRQVLINHRFDCIGMGLGLRVDEDDEPSLWLQFWLTAFDRPNITRLR